MINKGYILIFALLLCACTAPKDNNNPLLEPSFMVDFLFELHLNENIMGEGYISQLESATHYKALFDKYHVTAAQFDSAVVWYEAHRREYIAIYDQLKERYAQELAKIDSGIYHYYNPPVPTIWTYWGILPAAESSSISYAQFTHYLQLPAPKLRTYYSRCYPYIERFAGSAPYWIIGNQ